MMEKVKQYLDTNELTIENISTTLITVIKMMNEEDLSGLEKKSQLIAILTKYSKDEKIDEYIKTYANGVIDALCFVMKNKSKCRYLCCK